VNRKFLAVTTFIVLVTARISDVGITFWYNPSLTEEANPIVMVFGAGARTLIASVLVLFALLTVGLALFWRGSSLVLRIRPQSFLSFVKFWFRKVALNRHPLSTYFPRGAHWNEGLQALRLFGFALPWAFIFGSFAAVYAWLAIHGPLPNHRILFSVVSVGAFTGVHIVFAFVGFICGALLFFYSEYSGINAQEKQ
jgi:hypothetical protein